MKKRVFSLFAALALCLTLLPTAVMAAEAKPWETAPGDWTSLDDYNDSLKTLTTGNYYLTKDLLTDIGASFTVTDNAEVTVDLNGCYFADENDDSSTPRFRISNGGKFTLQDSKGGGFISGLSKNGVVSVEDNGSFTLKSGKVVSLGGTDAVAVSCKNGGAFTMEGGTLYSLMTSATTVRLQNGGTFTLNGGSVKATSLSSDGTTSTTDAIRLYYDSSDTTHTEKPVMNANGGTVEGTVKNLGGTIQSDRAQKATVFTDAPCLTVNEGEIVSTGERKSSTVYNGGTISGGVFENAVNDHCDWDDKIQSDGTITGGFFRGTLTCEGETISDGYFRYTADPNGHTKAGYYVNPSDIVGYTYVVNRTQPDPNAVYLFTAEMTASKVPADLSTEKKAELEALLKNASVTGVGAALSTAKMVEVAMGDSGFNFDIDPDTGKITGNDNIYIRIWVTVELTEYSNGALTFTATPKYDMVTSSKGMAMADSNGTDYLYKLTNDQLNGKPITVRLPLPDDYTPNQITHTCDDGTEEIFINKAYRPHTSAKHFTIETIDGVRYAVFTITRFSTFELSEEVTYVEPVSSNDSDPTYAIRIEDAEHGSVALSVRRKYAWAGDTVTLLVDPDRGWTLETLTVTDSRGSSVDVTAKNGKYTFKMPASKVTVTATFMEDNSMLSFFVDVPVESYYYDAVLWAAENGITGGVDETHFGPDRSCTRAQAVTFLYRAAQALGLDVSVGEDTNILSYNDAFDVPEYAVSAFQWAVGMGIVQGNNGDLDPNASCTRAQIVTFLHRFAVSAGLDVSVGEDTNILSYNDAFDVPEYAVSAFQWAVGAGIVQGNNGDLDPNASCTRAQIVTFLFRQLGD